MAFITNMINRFFDLLASPAGGHAAWAMLLLSVIGGLVMLLLFKVSTNQDKLVERKRVLIGRILESGLYQDHLGVLMRIQGDLAMANLRYLAVTAPALLALLPALIIFLGQLEIRFEHRPFEPGETALVTATVEAGQEALLNQLDLSCVSGVRIDSLPVRDPSRGSITWRVSVQRKGSHDLVLTAGNQSWNKQLSAVDGLPRLAGMKEKAGWHYLLFNPAEEPLSKSSPLHSIELDLPRRQTSYLGFEAHWLLAFCVISLIFGFAVKDLFKVKI